MVIKSLANSLSATKYHPTMSDETEGGSEELKKPAKEIIVVQDQGFFVHETGDTYDGSFEAKKKDRYLKMHGAGVYTTAEGDIYTGNWDADRLVGDEVTVSYIDGAKYEGPLKDWCYTGCGSYTFPDGAVLRGEFVENCPHKDMTITDPNGHIWLGSAETGFGWLQPWNHFYQPLEKRRDTRLQSIISPNHLEKTVQPK